MNVFKFAVFIKAKNTSSDIKQSIINCYSEKSKHTSNYKEFVERKWLEIGKEEIKTIYSEKAIVSYNNISNSKYFIVELDEHDSIDQVTYEVIVISSLEDVSQALNFVFDDIKSKLNLFHLKMVDNKALLFIYDGNDIISNMVMIKSNVLSFSKFRKREIIRMIIIILIAVISFIISSSNNTTVDNVCYSLIASCIFFVFSELLLKFNIKKTIEIKDLTNWVEKRDSLTTTKQFDEDYNNLQNPAV